ncbi:MAG: hypothetical protein HY657_01265 [Acidobacteria bacterium]|nr:hypothetical protein [Acidobacteriota bacterium]
MDLSATHVHLLLNHFPTVGFIVGLGLFIIGLAAKSDHLKVASLVTMFGIALLTIPVYVTGSGAQQQVCGPVNVPEPCPEGGPSRVLIEMHEGAAFRSLLWMELAGLLSWLGLWQYRRVQRIPGWNVALILLVSFVTVATVAQAANLGGEIRHPDIRVTQESTEVPLGRAVGNYVANTPFVWAAGETLHMIGLSLVIGVVLLIDLKLFGYASAIPYATLDRLLPWAMLGFALNIYTGMHFFVASPWQYVGNVAMNWKLVFLMAAGLNMLLFTLDPTWGRDGPATPERSKVMAATAIVLWVGVMFWGSMLPFIGQAF